MTFDNTCVLGTKTGISVLRGGTFLFVLFESRDKKTLDMADKHKFNMLNNLYEQIGE
jgi:hypothetical protein